jgi:hypothetical protein
MDAEEMLLLEEFDNLNIYESKLNSSIKSSNWLGGVVGYHVSLTRHSPSDTEGPEFKPRLSQQSPSQALFLLLHALECCLEVRA